jgi:hypothetical protein
VEYELKALRLRKLGPKRNSFGDVVRLEPNVRAGFPEADACQSSLRIPQENASKAQIEKPTS